MNFFQLKEYWRYRKVAKGRHGIHSPLVFQLIERAGKPHKKKSANSIIYQNSSGTIWPSNQLLQRITGFFHVSEIIVLQPKSLQYRSYFPTNNTEVNLPDLQMNKLWDCRYLAKDDLEKWLSCHLNLLTEKDCLLLENIHGSATQKAYWELLCSLQEIRMSLDFFNFGILFFLKNFKEKQHFILKNH